MYNKETARRIVEKVNEAKVVLASDASDLILGSRIIKYYYSSEEEKINHSGKMIKDGYLLCEKRNESLYCHLSLEIENIYVVVGIYEKPDAYNGLVF